MARLHGVSRPLDRDIDRVFQWLDPARERPGALLTPVGFPVLTLIFLIVFMKILGVPRWRTILIVAVGTTICSMLIFETWLAVPFPKGLWWPE